MPADRTCKACCIDYMFYSFLKVHDICINRVNRTGIPVYGITGKIGGNVSRQEDPVNIALGLDSR